MYKARVSKILAFERVLRSGCDAHVSFEDQKLHSRSTSGERCVLAVSRPSTGILLPQAFSKDVVSGLSSVLEQPASFHPSRLLRCIPLVATDKILAFPAT